MGNKKNFLFNLMTLLTWQLSQADINFIGDNQNSTSIKKWAKKWNPEHDCKKKK